VEQRRSARGPADDAADSGVVQAALRGDRQATEQLVAHLAPTIQVRVGTALLRRRGRARGRNLRQEVEDLSQEVFAALFEDEGRVLRRWDPMRGLSLKSFVGLVAEREAGMILRTGKRSPFREDPTAAEELDSQLPSSTMAVGAAVESSELLTVVLDELREHLSPQGLFIFQLLFIEERSVEDAAALAGLSADAIYAWRSRISRLARDIRARVTATPAAPAAPSEQRRST
jgi:DNA-directed RNA polymerase specialized sigma24 family protein